MLHFPEMVRNIAIVGHLHHGKTMLLDMLIGETHGLVWDANEPVGCMLFPMLTLNLFSGEVHRHASVISPAWNIYQVVPHFARCNYDDREITLDALR